MVRSLFLERIAGSFTIMMTSMFLLLLVTAGAAVTVENGTGCQKLLNKV